MPLRSVPCWTAGSPVFCRGRTSPVHASQSTDLWSGAGELDELVSGALGMTQSLLRTALSGAEDPRQMLAVKDTVVNAVLALR